MVHSINIRPANTGDSKDVARLLTLLGYSNSEEFVVGRIEILRCTRAAEVFVAELNGTVVGVMSFDVTPLFHQEGNIGCITSLYVDPDFHGHGVGTALVNAGEKFALENGCIKISVASGMRRTKAHEFYRKLGYEENTKRFLKMLK